MKLFVKIGLEIILFFLFILLLNANSFADLMILADDSIIQGKVVREDERVYFFSNSDGTFEVKKVHVKEVIESQSYQEDLVNSKKFNFPIESKKAKANFDAGMRKKMLMTKSTKRKYYEYWDYGRLSISVSYFATISQEETGKTTANKVLPNGFSGQLAYEQGLDMLLDIKIGKKKKSKENIERKSKKKYKKTKPRPMGMPGLRIEWTYMYFTKDVFVNDDKEVSGSTYTVGPMWYFPSPHNVWGCFMIATMPGYSFMKVNNREAGITKNNYSFALTLLMGYEYAIKQKVALLFHARYTYIADKYISFHGIGASFGVSIRLW